MTEGIIQKVFSNFYKEHPSIWEYHLEQLQKELIEKIKQEFPKNFHKDSPEINAIWLAWIRRKLIGDNQE